MVGNTRLWFVYTYGHGSSVVGPSLAGIGEGFEEEGESPCCHGDFFVVVGIAITAVVVIGGGGGGHASIVE